MEKTFIVLGAPRGGTSLVSGLLREMEIFMGDGLGHNHEDPKFLTMDIKELRHTIRDRNEKYKVWGWKMPHIIFHLDQIIEEVRNPQIILVYRNQLNVAYSQVRRSDAKILTALKVTNDYYGKIHRFIDKFKGDVYFVSYEDLVSDSKQHVIDLATFVGYEMSDKVLKNCIQFIDPTTGYKNISKEQFDFVEVTEEDLSDLDVLKPGADYKYRLINGVITNNSDGSVEFKREGVTYGEKGHVHIRLLKSKIKNVYFKIEPKKSAGTNSQKEIWINLNFGDGFNGNLNKKAVITEKVSYYKVHSKFGQVLRISLNYDFKLSLFK